MSFDEWKLTHFSLSTNRKVKKTKIQSKIGCLLREGTLYYAKYSNHHEGLPSRGKVDTNFTFIWVKGKRQR